MAIGDFAGSSAAGTAVESLLDQDKSDNGQRHGVLCIGETMVLLAPQRESIRIAPGAEFHVAGAESNVAVGLATLGHPAEWFSRLGDDPFGWRILDDLASRGVSTSLVETDQDSQTGIYFKEIAGDASRVLYYRQGSAASRMEAVDLAALELPRRRICHVTGITPALSTSCAQLVTEVLSGRSGRTVTSFDVNYRPALWPVDEAGPALLRYSRLADIVFVGRDEAEKLWGTVTADDVREMLPGVEVLVVKDAEIGATAFTVEGRVHVPAPHVDVVEAIGAGDAFAAGYLAGWLEGMNPQRSLRLGHVLAAQALVQRGDVPKVDDVEHLRSLVSLTNEDWEKLRFAHRDAEVNDGVR